MNILTGQLDALARAFFVRFFESEITTGTDDLKQFFFWLLAALAIPGLFIPWMMAFDWQLLALIEGPEMVRIASRAEKTFYLGFSMIAAGMLDAIAWSRLLPDRRDTLILGALPVRPRVVVHGQAPRARGVRWSGCRRDACSGIDFLGLDPRRQSFAAVLRARHRGALHRQLGGQHVGVYSQSLRRRGSRSRSSARRSFAACRRCFRWLSSVRWFLAWRRCRR